MQRTRRPRIVSTWLSRDEHSAVVAAARSRGQTLAAFLRRSAVARARGVIRRDAAPRRDAVAERLVRQVRQALVAKGA